MSGVIVEKQIVVKAIDHVSEPLARMNERLSHLEQSIGQFNSKMTAGASSQQQFKTALNETKASASEASASLHKITNTVDKLSHKKADIKPKVDSKPAENGLNKINHAIDHTKKAGSTLKDFIGGNLIANGISNIASHLGDWAKQGYEAAKAGTEVAERWKNLGMTNSEVKATATSVTQLRENSNLSGEAVGNLVTRFYGFTGSAARARQLATGVASLADKMKLSGSQADAFANGLTRIETAGTVSTRTLGRLEKTAPGITKALQQASGMGAKAFNQLLSSGKMTSDQFNDLLARASKDFKKNSEEWAKTPDGAIKQMQEKFLAARKTIMMPLVASSGTGLNALSKAMDKLQPQFTELGKAIADVATKFAKWLTPKHAEDLGKIVASLGRMAGVLAKGAWKAVTAPLEIIGRVINGLSGKKGDALDNVATALDHISKNKVAMNVLSGIGAVLMAQFAYSKLSKVGNGLLNIGNAIGFIGKHKLSGNLFADFAKGIKGLSKVKINPKSWFVGGKGWVKNLFKPATEEALRTGDQAGGNFITRFAAKTNASKFAELGRTTGGKLVSGIGLAFEAVDFVKDLHGALTSHNATARSRDAGKAVGAGVGAGIGFFFGGPAGAALGGMIGRVIGGKIGPTLGKFGKGTAKLLGDIFKKHDWKAVWSDIGKGWKSFWTGMGNWWDKVIGKKGSSKKSSSSSSSSKKIKSLGGNHYSKTDIANVKEMNRAIIAYTKSLKTLKSAIKKNDPTKELNSMNKKLKSFTKNLKKSKVSSSIKSLGKNLSQMTKSFKKLDKPMNQAEKRFKSFEKTISKLGNKKTGLSRVDTDIKSLSKDLQKYNFSKTLSKQMNEANKAVGKHGFIKTFNAMTKQLESDLRTFGKDFKRYWENTWKNLGTSARRGISRARSAVSSGLNHISSTGRNFENGFKRSWRSWLDDLVSAFRTGFDKLPGIAGSSMRQIVSRLNSGISAINAVISDFGGDKRLGTIHYARGTFAHPGGKAVVNDGPEANKTELIWQPSKGWGTAQGQNVVRDLEAGSMVLDAKRSQPYLGMGIFPHYANGTLSEDEQDKIAEEFIDNPVKASRDLVLKVTNWNSNIPIIPSLGKATAIGFSKGIANVLKDLLGIIKEPINGDWTPVIKSAARLLHFHISSGQIAKLLRQIQTESGGREVATNNWDSNAKAGHPSQGLLQFVPSTFYHWAVGKYRNINKGFDQILAAINALNHGGEGGWGNIGNGHGWAHGGHITSLDYGYVGDNAEHDEYVINPYNDRALPLMQEAWAKMQAHHPEWQNHAGSSYNGQMIALMQTAIEAIKGIDLQPTVQVEDMAKPLQKYEAKQYTMLKGGR